VCADVDQRSASRYCRRSGVNLAARAGVFITVGSQESRR
jgi:hypothetical protein